MKQALSMRNYVTVEHRRNGELLHRERGPNLIVDAGFDWLAAQIGGAASANPMKYIALTGNTDAVVAGDTALTGEYADVDGLNRAEATYAHTPGTKTFTLQKVFTKGAAAAKTPGKSALFNQLAVGGTMLAGYLITSPPAMLSGDSLTVTWTITLS